MAEKPAPAPVIEKKDVYLIGGEDLEMQRVRQQLKRQGAEVVDKALHQRDADVDVYSDEVAKAIERGDTPVAVELRGADQADGVEIVDHHGLEYSHRDASITQVLERLGVEPNLIDKVIAANDSKYIGGMIELLDNEYKARFLEKRGGGEEAEARYAKVRNRIINSVRAADRRAQGVTPIMEAEAEEAIKNMEELPNGMRVIRVNSIEMSPVTDRMYGTWGDGRENMVIVGASDQSEKEIWFFGRGDVVKSTMEHFRAKKQARIEADPNEPPRRGRYHTVGGGPGLGHADMNARCLVVADSPEEVISFIQSEETRLASESK